MTRFAQLPTSDSKLTYLVDAWSSFDGLPADAQFGYAQLLIISLCGHVERFISQRLLLELQDVSHMLWKADLRDWAEERDGSTFQVDHHPVYALESRVRAFARRLIEHATFAELKRLHKIITTEGIADLVGNDLANDMEGVSSARNIFAHGRPVLFELGSEWISIEDFVQHPFEETVKALKRERILTDDDLRHKQPEELLAVLLGKRSLYFFWDRSRKFINTYVAHLPERRKYRLADYELPSLPS